MTPEDAIAPPKRSVSTWWRWRRPPARRCAGSWDYGRYKYEQKKKANKSKGHAASLKEVKLRPRTDQHDLDFKLKNARRFLMDGDKVKVTVMYRGREMVHRELGRKQLDLVVELLGPIATVENPPRMEGRFLSMILVPNREGIEAEEEGRRRSGGPGGRRRLARNRGRAGRQPGSLSHAEDEDPPGRRQALQEDGHWQDRALAQQQAAHPHQEDGQAEAQAPQAGAGVADRPEAPGSRCCPTSGRARRRPCRE